MNELSGIIPPLILPMTPAGEVDAASLRRQVEFLMAAGVGGLWVNGTTGEFYALEADERAAVVAEVVRAADGRVPVIAQVGDTVTRRAVRHARAAVEAGAGYVAAIAPYYVAFSQAELVAYYRDLAAAVVVPLVVYQLPQMTKVSLTVENVLALAREGTITAIKDSASDMTYFRALTAQARAGGVPLRCFVGGGSLVDTSLLMGGHGAMCAIANLVPRHCVALYRAAAANEWVRAAQLQAELQDFIQSLLLPARPQWVTTVAVYKWLLRAEGVIDTDTAAAPLAPLSAADQAHLEAQALPRMRRLEARAAAPAEAAL